MSEYNQHNVISDNPSTSLYFTLKKQELYMLIQKSYRDSLDLYDAVKKDFPRMSVRLNGFLQSDLTEFVQWIRNYDMQYLQPILLLCNQNAHYYYYEKLYNILVKHDYHLVTRSYDAFKTAVPPLPLETNVTLLPIMKQVCVKNEYEVIEIAEPEHDKIVRKRMNVEMIVDLCQSSDVLIRVHLF
jgi:hypothetical protein